MNSLLAGFTSFIKKENLFQRKDKLLVAVSGGIDSVVLCDLCQEGAYDYAIAHCNFQLRGDESERDETFVASLAKKYNVPLFSKRFDTADYADKNKVSIQVAARDLRYAWFQELAAKNNDLAKNAFNHKVVILTAHHANDNVETLLMNFFKGTGINGLKGISPKNDKIIRPLLFASRTAITEYATEKNLEYVEDSSNSSDKYTRNYFRNTLLPGVQQVFPMVEKNLQNNLEKFRDIHTLYKQAVDLQTSKLVKVVEKEVHLPVLKLIKTEAVGTILFEIIKPYNFSPAQVPDVMQLLNSETNKFVQSQSHRIIRNRDWLIISPLDTTQAINITIQEKDTSCAFSSNTLLIKKHINKADFITASESTACIDSGKLVFPLLLRKSKTGDYFYPLGMQKKKKLSKFFSDSKLSLPQKENVWVIESDKKIVWVVGLRIDDRFKVTAATEEVVKFTVK